MRNITTSKLHSFIYNPRFIGVTNTWHKITHNPICLSRQTTPTSPPTNQNAAALHRSHSHAQFCSLFDWQLLERGDLSCSAVSFLNCCRVTDPITICLELVRVKDRWRIDEHPMMQVWRILNLHSLYTSGILQHYRFCLLCSLFLWSSIFNLARGKPHRCLLIFKVILILKLSMKVKKTEPWKSYMIALHLQCIWWWIYFNIRMWSKHILAFERDSSRVKTLFYVFMS